MKKFITIIIALSVAACGSGEDDENVQAWCDTVEEFDVFLGKVSAVEDEATYEEYSDITKRFRDLRPTSLKEDFEVIDEIDRGTVRIDEQERYDKAADEINGYIRDKCGLDIQWAGRE